MTGTAANTAHPLQLRFTATGWGWLVVALLAGGYVWFKSINMVIIIVYAMLMLVIINGLVAWRSVRRTRAERLSIHPVFAGEWAECGVRVTNAARYPVTVTVADQAEPHSNTFLVYRLPGGQSLTCTAAREFPHRGRFRGPVAIVSGYPFGFIECERRGDASHEIVVLPRLGYAEPDGLRRWMLRQMGNDGRNRKVLRRVTNDQAEVRGVRSYRPGDAIRDIHWRSSARRGELLVREYDTAPLAELLLVVEPWLPSQPSRHERQQLEDALSLAATIAVTWRRAFDHPVTVAVVGRSESAATANSEEDLRDALTPLADVAGSPTGELRMEDGFHRRVGRSARVIVSSRPRTPLVTHLTRVCGKPFVAISPGDALPWYLPPAMQKRKTNHREDRG
ncbi:MAG: DUF58 domain-containing protein [Gemmataceae bacterium]|nr:DUF58 domain-containing protein [Gemmata sp.]MDW8199271.1 DUF58 domain-containing protein [Gemmataceae bacterium]